MEQVQPAALCITSFLFVEKIVKIKNQSFFVALESNVQSLIVVPNLPVSTDCQMTGFTADIMGGKKNDKYNVTIRWDAIVDGFPKVYFVRHGSALRSLIFSTSDDILFDYDDPVPVVDDINNVSGIRCANTQQ